MHYIDLHIHLDGSLPPETIITLADQSGYSLPANTPEELMPFLTVGEDCESLNTYLQKFEIPIDVLQTEECLELAVYEVLRTLSEQNMIYTELRFAPSSHCHRGLCQEQVLDAALSGLQKGMAAFPIRAQLIACCMRGTDNEKANLETVRCARRYLGEGICCVDLAGAEAIYPTSDYAALFAYAREVEMPFIIHAGEASGPESVRTAVSFGARRIGHGIAAAKDPKLMEILCEKRIPLEVCLTSNVQTKAVPDLSSHPIRQFLDRGIVATLNTDNMTVSNTSLEKEFTLARRSFGLDSTQIRRLQMNAVDSAFLTETQKDALREIILQDVF